jgi:hypothetical protein
VRVRVRVRVCVRACVRACDRCKRLRGCRTERHSHILACPLEQQNERIRPVCCEIPRGTRESG